LSETSQQSHSWCSDILFTIGKCVLRAGEGAIE